MKTQRTHLAWGAACAVFVAALAGLPHARPQDPPAPAPPWAAQADAVFTQWDKPESPGCALGVYQDGRTVYARGYGVADLEQGRLGADDDVRKYVPELPDYGRPITIRHLVHHTSGLRDINTLMVLAGRRDEDAFDKEMGIGMVVMASKDAREGPKAFLEKRKPNFTGE